MKTNRKGFTLVELLAVIVILAVIALIATPVVLSMIEASRKGAAESSMLSYVSSIENTILTKMMSPNSRDYSSPYAVEGLTLYAADETGNKLTGNSAFELPIEVKGEQPVANDHGNTVNVRNNVVTNARLKFGNYYVTYFYADGKATYCSSNNASTNYYSTVAECQEAAR